jgi:hypothetical protein
MINFALKYMIKMKKILLMMILAVVLPISITAKNYIPGEPWPRDGYKLSTWVTPTCARSIEVQRFVDADFFYLKVRTIGLKDGEFYYLAIIREVADSILRFTSTDEFFPKKLQREKWMEEFLKSTGFEGPTDKTEWTKYKPKKVLAYKQHNGRKYAYLAWRRFDQSAAWDTYCEQRHLDPKTGEQRKQVSAEGMMAFMSMVKNILPVMAAGSDSRTLYDKIMQDGGY